jgi:hypothetical protein
MNGFSAYVQADTVVLLLRACSSRRLAREACEETRFFSVDMQICRVCGALTLVGANSIPHLPFLRDEPCQVHVGTGNLVRSNTSHFSFRPSTPSHTTALAQLAATVSSLLLLLATLASTCEVQHDSAIQSAIEHPLTFSEGKWAEDSSSTITTTAPASSLDSTLTTRVRRWIMPTDTFSTSCHAPGTTTSVGMDLERIGKCSYQRCRTSQGSR